jgi:hypothetical protein
MQSSAKKPIKSKVVPKKKIDVRPRYYRTNTSHTRGRLD